MAEKKNYFPVVLNNFVAYFEDPVGLARPLWRDYSYWQKIVNPDIAITNGVYGAAFRAAVGTSYRDSYFAANYEAFDRDEVHRTSYFVIVPGLSVIKQADVWYEMHEYLDVIPRVIDLEISNYQSVGRIADNTWTLVEKVFDRDGVYPIIYSRKNLIDTWLASWTDEMLNKVWWWLAQYLLKGYLEHPGPPDLPERVKRERIILHQTSDHKLAPAGEVASRAVDWDRWELGNVDEMQRFINATWGSGAVIQPPPDAIIPIDHVITASNLNMRTKPDANSLDIGTLKLGSDVSLTKKDGVWGKVEGWIHTGYTNPA